MVLKSIKLHHKTFLYTTLHYRASNTLHCLCLVSCSFGFWNIEFWESMLSNISLANRHDETLQPVWDWEREFNSHCESQRIKNRSWSSINTSWKPALVTQIGIWNLVHINFTVKFDEAPTRQDKIQIELIQHKNLKHIPVTQFGLWT